MKKSSNKVDMQKPKKGDLYKIYDDMGLTLSNIMRIVKIHGKFAYYTILAEEQCGVMVNHRWNFEHFPECLGYKLSTLEMELL